MLVAIEGCDRAGKTTLWSALRPLLPFATFVPGRPSPVELKPHMRYLEERDVAMWESLYDPQRVYVCDRCPFVDNAVYAEVYGRPPVSYPQWASELRIIYLRPPAVVLRSRGSDPWDPDFDRERAVYDRVIAPLQHITNPTVEEAAAAVVEWDCERFDRPRAERERFKEVSRQLHWRRQRGRPEGEQRRALELELLELRVAAQRRRVAEVANYYRGQLGCTLGHKPVGQCTLLGRECRAADVEASLGKPPFSGAVLCHRCDVRECARPSHLFWGTARDNARDAVLKGRFASRRSHAELLHFEQSKLAALLEQWYECQTGQPPGGPSQGARIEPDDTGSSPVEELPPVDIPIDSLDSV